jgi:benzoate/toluate 1,2-dioxygenase subunit alpha
MLCRHKRQNKATFTCPFHGWTFNNTGKLLKVKDPEGAGYPDQFNKNGSHDLKRVARFESYRGFLFGSLNADVMPLSDYLGEARVMIDMVVDQSDEGLEVLRGSSTYTYAGNWKLQAENGADGYHVSAVHWNYVATTSHRADEGKDEVKSVNASKWNKQKGGFYSFDNGHLVLWTKWADPSNRPLAPRRDELVAKYGEAKADWMIGYLRNLCLYPNLFLMDQFSSQLRVFRPISVDQTEVTIYCIAPKGESQEARTRRIRQYEDFFNASGMATPDDLEEFRATQMGYAAAPTAQWNDLTRGAKQWITGADEEAERIGMKPILSGARTEDEGLFVIQHRQWTERMAAAVAAERSNTTKIAAE